MTISEEYYAVFSLIVYIIYGLFTYASIKKEKKEIRKAIDRLGEKKFNKFIKRDPLGESFLLIGLSSILILLFIQNNINYNFFICSIPLLIGITIYAYLGLSIKRANASKDSIIKSDYKDRKIKQIKVLAILFCLFCSSMLIGIIGDTLLVKGHVTANNIISRKYTSTTKLHSTNYHFEVKPIYNSITLYETDHKYSLLNQIILKVAKTTSLLFLYHNDWKELPDEVNVEEKVYNKASVGDTILCNYTITSLGNTSADYKKH